MDIRKCVILPVCFPRTRHDFDDFIKTLDFLKSSDIHCVEFYYEGSKKQRVFDEIRARGLETFYIAVIPLKEKNLSLCSMDNEERKKAVEQVRICVDDAVAAGSSRIIINSGKAPLDPSFDGKCQKYFIDSCVQISENIGKFNTDKEILISLEPCDSKMMAKNLIGPTNQAVLLCEELDQKHIRLALTMDIAHIVEEGESVINALTASEKYCDHVHFANCIIQNKDHPLYGDCHPGFDFAESEFPPSRLDDIYKELSNFKNKLLYLGIEYLCREDDPMKYFTSQVNRMEWFNTKV